MKPLRDLLHPGFDDPTQRAEPGRAANNLLADCRTHGAGEDSLATGVVLLSHGHLEPAHEISQIHKGGAGSYLHGLMHRLEPDLANACYWFRRVGNDDVRLVVTTRISALDADLGAFHDADGWSPLAWTEHLMAGRRDDALEHRVLVAECHGLLDHLTPE